MRLHLSLLLSGVLLSGCAYQGTIVEKSHQPYPMYLSHGIEGKYTFIVQDKAGVRHRQMVTPEVFERYAIGQYFNDQETGPSGTLDEGKSIQSTTMTASKSPAAGATRYASKPATKSGVKATVARKSSKQTQRVAAKVKARRAALAAAKRKRAKPAKIAVTVANVVPAAPAAAAPIVEVNPPAVPLETDFRVVTVARCR